MSYTLIGPKLDNYDNEIEDPKVDNVEEYQASVLLNININEKDGASISSTKKLHS